jgi:sigma-B regulation protein RsbU (phosphoserine phosphatase)
MKILVIDDARDMRLLVQAILKRLGHDVVTAENGLDAWKKINETIFQVIISDWMMPGLDGLQLCKKIRDANFRHYAYFILLTGMSGKENLLHAIEAGCDDFATKPAHPDELRVRLRSAERVINLEAKLEHRNAELQKANEIIEHDLERAAELQTSLLPAPLESEKVCISWYFKPAVFIGGDSFNYFYPNPEDKDLLIFFSADVSGHGAASAMLSMFLYSSFLPSSGLYEGAITRERLHEIPAIFARNLNILVNKTHGGHYLTMLFGVLDLSASTMFYTQAGHPYPFHYDAANKNLKTLEVTGFPIGLLEDAEYETQQLQMKKGDKFVMYSDGICEHHSVINNELLTTVNLKQHLSKIIHVHCKDMLCHIKHEWLSEEQLENPLDDLSIVIIKI